MSLSAWMLGALTGLVFCLYGCTAHVWSLALSEGAFAVGAALICATVASYRITARAAALSAGTSVLVINTCTQNVIAVLGLLGAVGMRLLQLGRTWRSTSVAGVSTWSWVLLCANVTAWGAYGLRTNHWPLVATSVLSLVAAVALLGVVRHTQHAGT